MVRVDPVCGMGIVEADAPQTKFNNVRYHFCCEMCLGAFLERPGRYLKLDWSEDEILTSDDVQYEIEIHSMEGSCDK